MPVSRHFLYQRPECWKVLRAVDKTRRRKTNPLFPQQPVRTIPKNPGCANLHCSLVRLQALFTSDLFMGLYSGHICKHIDMAPATRCFGFRRKGMLRISPELTFHRFILHTSLFLARWNYSPALSPTGSRLPTLDLTSRTREHVRGALWCRIRLMVPSGYPRLSCLPDSPEFCPLSRPAVACGLLNSAATKLWAPVVCKTLLLSLLACSQSFPMAWVEFSGSWCVMEFGLQDVYWDQHLWKEREELGLGRRVSHAGLTHSTKMARSSGRNIEP